MRMLGVSRHNLLSWWQESSAFVWKIINASQDMLKTGLYHEVMVLHKQCDISEDT